MRPLAPAVSAPRRPTRTLTTSDSAMVHSRIENPASLTATGVSPRRDGRRWVPIPRGIGAGRRHLDQTGFAKRVLHSRDAMDNPLYFRQLLTGRDIARSDPVA